MKATVTLFWGFFFFTKPPYSISLMNYTITIRCNMKSVYKGFKWTNCMHRYATTLTVTSAALFMQCKKSCVSLQQLHGSCNLVLSCSTCSYFFSHLWKEPRYEGTGVLFQYIKQFIFWQSTYIFFWKKKRTKEKLENHLGWKTWI